MTLNVGRFNTDAADLGATRCFRNGCGVVRIVLLPSEISLDHGGGDQLDFMVQRLNRTRPKMSAASTFDGDQTGGLLA